MEKYSKFQRSSWSSRAKEFNKAGGGITVTSNLPLAYINKGCVSCALLEECMNVYYCAGSV